MTVETLTKRIVLKASVPKSGQAFQLRLVEGAGTEDADTIEDVVRQLIAGADLRPTDVPQLARARPGVLVIEVLGGPVGTRALALLLVPTVERAVANAGRWEEASSGGLQVRTRWTAKGAKVDSDSPPVPEGVVPDKTKTRRPPPVRGPFATASLGDLVAAYTPRDTDHALQRLEEILTEAQGVPPPDKAAFVRDVNMLLDVLSLRIRTDDGDLGRLVLDGNGQMGLTRRGRGGNRGFKNTTIRLVPVPRVHAGNRYTGPRTHLEP